MYTMIQKMMNQIDSVFAKLNYTKLMATIAFLSFPIGMVSLGFFFYIENAKTKKSIKRFISNYDASIQRNIIYLERNLYKLTLEVTLLKKYIYTQHLQISQIPQKDADSQTQNSQNSQKDADSQTQNFQIPQKDADSQTQNSQISQKDADSQTDIQRMEMCTQTEMDCPKLFSQQEMGEGYDWLY